jgi:hypothetical protein
MRFMQNVEIWRRNIMIEWVIICVLGENWQTSE